MHSYQYPAVSHWIGELGSLYRSMHFRLDLLQHRLLSFRCDRDFERRLHLFKQPNHPHGFRNFRGMYQSMRFRLHILHLDLLSRRIDSI